MRKIKKHDWTYILLFLILCVAFIYLGFMMIFNDKGWSYGDLFNLLVALGTMILALVTAHAQNETRETIDVATRSAIATEKSVESMKDALMPQIILSVDCKDETNSNPSGVRFFLTARNVGPGSGTIRLITSRDDLPYGSPTDLTTYWAEEYPEKLHKDKLIDFTIGSKETYVFQLKCGNTIPRAQGANQVSSLSLFYEDVYGRIYRSRIIYKWSNPNGQIEITSIGREFEKTTLPIVPFGHDYYPKLSELEGGNMCRHIEAHEKLYRLRYLKMETPIIIPGNDFTKNLDISLIRLSFNWTGYPVFKFHLKGYEALSIEVSDVSSELKYRYDSNGKSLKDLGFDPDENIDKYIQDTYIRIRTALLSNA